MAAWIWMMSGFASDPRHPLGIGGKRQGDAFCSGRNGREYRVGLRDRQLAREGTVADEHPDMIDPEAHQRASLLGGLHLVDLHQHAAEPNSWRGERPR